MKNLSFLILLSALLCWGCDKDSANEARTLEGPKVAVGDGQAWTFVTLDNQEEPTRLGVRFSASALQNLPTGSPHGDEFMLALPSEISVEPYDHVTLDWNEHGHEPMHVYDLPHFDLHFYFMSPAQRDRIGPFDSTEFNRPLPADYLPPDYLETPGGVPRMGAHIIDLLSPEIAGTGVFTHTFIYGKYDGKVNFLEPMVTKATLDARTEVSQEIRWPEAWQREGYYPRQYHISFDAGTETYSIYLDELQWMTAD